MTDIRKEGKGQGEVPGKKRPRIGRLEINKESVESLTDEQAEAARGGAAEADQYGYVTKPMGLRGCA